MQILNPIEELHSTNLFQFLLTSSPEYADRITKFVEEISGILKTTETYFPYYTRHDAHHGFRVVRRIEQVCTSECFQRDKPEKFSPVELFLLIAAAYAHDLGMTIFPNETDELLKKLGLTKQPDWETNPMLQSYLRQEHSRRGGDYINKNFEKFGVPKNLTSILDLMMKAHNLSVSELEKTISSEFAAQEIVIDIRQLAVIVCVADALEFSDTRVMDGVLDRIKIDTSKSARISYQENMKHICLGDSLAIDNHGRVIVNGTFDEVEVLALAHQTFDQMEEWIQGYCDINRRSEFPRLKVRPEPFVRELNFTLGRFERLGIRLNKKNVIDLIASNAVWNANAGIAIRELVQNSIEACRFRLFHSAQVDQYSPSVRVEFDSTQRTIAVIDNGCGMSERTILNNFLTVGSSRSKESGYIGETYAPIARFGIGFWSVFTIAESAHIQTVAFEDYRGKPQEANHGQGVEFDVSLAELKDYTVFLPITQACGTKVTLTLRDDIEFDNIYSQARAMLLCSEIPVTFVLDSEEIEIPKNIPDVTDEDILGSRTQFLLSQGFQVFKWRGRLGDTELSIGIAYLIKDGKATFCTDQAASILSSITPGILSSRTSICGLSVQIRPASLCFELNRVGKFFANRLTPKNIEFSLDRQQIISNTTSKQYQLEIAELIHQGYREFLKATNSYTPESIATLRDQAAMNGGNVYDTFTKSELSDAVLRYPDLICFRLFPVNQIFTKPIYLNSQELSEIKGKVFFMQNRAEINIGQGRFRIIEPEASTMLIHTLMQNKLSTNRSLFNQAYVMDANRLASMLFDADPKSEVFFCDVMNGLSQEKFKICIQSIELGNVIYNRSPENILCSVQGRWSGTIYLRNFKNVIKEPFIFLGRHRVLIEESSKLAQFLQGLHDDGKFAKLANTIFQLQEAESGYPPEEIKSYL